MEIKFNELETSILEVITIAYRNHSSVRNLRKTFPRQRKYHKKRQQRMNRFVLCYQKMFTSILKEILLKFSGIISGKSPVSRETKPRRLHQRGYRHSK